MRRGGRARCCISIALYSCFFNIVGAGGADYGVPVEIKLWDTGRTPIAHMVDVTNGFGLKVLAEHNFLNDNNIAFSPYGLMGIMVALFEGVDGESSYQIQRGMQLPWNRNVMRIGFRDIHRTLKTYFVPEEGFLAGLALNNENVTFNDSYKKILRFYGFDLENDKLPTIPPTKASSTNETSAAPSTIAPGSETTTVSTPTMSTENKPEETTTGMVREETTLNPNAETIDVDIRAPTETTTVLPTSAPDTETTPITTVNVDPTTTLVSETITQTPEAETTTLSPSPTTTTLAPLITQTASESSTTTETSMSMETDAETIAQQTSQASSALTEPTANNELATTGAMGASTTESTSIASTTMTTTLSDTSEMATTSMSNTPTDGSTTSSDGTTSADIATTTDSPLETLQRRKKSIVDFIFTNPPYVDDYFFYRSYHVGPELPDPGFDDKIFLANGLKSVQVTYMHYDTVLEHAYLPHLGASALRLPLDSDRYYLLVVLPNRGSGELGRLLARMARESDLADVYAALRPRRVRAVVPSFIVKGHITLTTDLQKLGIVDVFEPRQRDFSPMTCQRGVYVRSIEQAVSVAIRKYRPDEHKTNRYVINRDPVTFSATYPFLYFVMDATIHVALMAGKMVDPLNSRIL